MSRLCKPQEEQTFGALHEEGIKQSMNLFLKTDMPRLSSKCKVEVLRVLGELLEIPGLSTNRSNDVTNMVIKCLFDERPDRCGIPPPNSSFLFADSSPPSY